MIFLHLSKHPPTNFIVLYLIALLLCCDLFCTCPRVPLPILLCYIVLHFYCAGTFLHLSKGPSYLFYCARFYCARFYCNFYCVVTFLHLSKGPSHKFYCARLYCTFIVLEPFCTCPSYQFYCARFYCARFYCNFYCVVTFLHLFKGAPTNFIVLNCIALLLCCDLFALVQGSLLPILLC